MVDASSPTLRVPAGATARSRSPSPTAPARRSTASTCWDPLWGTAGTVTRDGARSGRRERHRPGPNGTVYAAWDDWVAADGVTIVRYDADGTPDPSFGGGDGEVTFTEAVLGHVDDMSVDSRTAC